MAVCEFYNAGKCAKTDNPSDDEPCLLKVEGNPPGTTTVGPADCDILPNWLYPYMYCLYQGLFVVPSPQAASIQTLIDTAETDAISNTIWVSRP